MKKYSSILCQIMIGALMSIGISAQADLNFPYPDMLYKNIFCTCCLMQDESNLAKNKVHFSAVQKPSGLIEGFLSLELKDFYKNVSINFDFDSEITDLYPSYHLPMKIQKNPKKPNNYTIFNIEGSRHSYLFMFLFEAPFDVPQNVFVVSEGDDSANSREEDLSVFLPVTTNDNPSADKGEMKPGPIQGDYDARLMLHYWHEPIEL